MLLSELLSSAIQAFYYVICEFVNLDINVLLIIINVRRTKRCGRRHSLRIRLTNENDTFFLEQKTIFEIAYVAVVTMHNPCEIHNYIFYKI